MRGLNEIIAELTFLFEVCSFQPSQYFLGLPVFSSLKEDINLSTTLR